MKSVLTILLGLSFIGCASQQPAANLKTPDSAVIGEKPEGYPKTVIKRLPDLPGFCVEVTEDWREHPRHVGSSPAQYREGFAVGASENVVITGRSPHR